MGAENFNFISTHFQLGIILNNDVNFIQDFNKPLEDFRILPDLGTLIIFELATEYPYHEKLFQESLDQVAY